MRRSPAVLVILLASLMLTLAVPALAADGPGRVAPASLAGSKLTFVPAAGTACYTPGVQGTFAFDGYSQTGDYEYAYYLWLKFSNSWSVSSVAVTGTPSCAAGSWGSFGWQFTTSPYELQVTHYRYQAPSDQCTARYLVQATPSVSATGDANVSWYWSGDHYGSAPHHPCSSDGYGPAGQDPCDSSVDLPAVIPMCTATAEADLSVTIDDGASTYLPGADQVYTVTVSNAGAAGVTDAAVSTILPDGVVDATWSCSASAGSSCAASGTGGIADTPDLLSGGTATYTWTLEVLENWRNDLVAQASVSVPAGVTETDPGDNSDTDTDTLAPVADLSISKSGSFTLVRGGEAVYEITVENAGPADATGVVVSDPTPAGMTFVSNSGDCTTPFPCSLGTIPAGEARTITALFRVDPATTLTRFVNEATVESPADYELGTNAAAAEAVIGTDIPLLEPRALLALVLLLVTAAALRMR